MKRFAIFFIVIALLVIGIAALQPSTASAAFGPCGTPGADPCPPGRSPTQEDRVNSITVSGVVTDPGSGIVINVPKLPEGATVFFDIRNYPPQDTNGVFGLSPLVGINFKGGHTMVEVKIPVPSNFKGRELSIAQYVNGKYVLASGYRSGNYMVFRTSGGGDFTIVESDYLK